MSKYIGATVVNLSVDTVDVTGDITATDATPEVIIVNDTHEDTDGGREGKVTFKGQQSGGEETTLAQIQASHDGTSDDEKGDLIFKVNDGSDGASPTERLRIGSDGATTITTDGNEDTLVLKSNDADANAGPKLQFNRNSASPADDDFLGEIRFDGRNDAGQAVEYAKIAAKLQDASDGTEDIRLSLKSIVGGTERERITIQPSEVVINEDSQDLDFRVESDSATHAFFVEGDGNGGSNDVAIGINTNAPEQLGITGDGPIIHISGDDSQIRMDNNIIHSDNSGNTALYIRTNYGATNAGAELALQSGFFRVHTGTSFTERMRIDSDGDVGIGNTAPAMALHVDAEKPNDFMTELDNTSATNPYVMVMRTSGAANDNNLRHFIYATDSAAVRFIVDVDGDVRNHDNSYGSLSDERIKESISDATSQWDDIKALKVRKFKFKDDVRQYGDDAKFKLGLIAQEAELVSPNLIQEASPTPNNVLSSSEFGTLYEDGDELPKSKRVGDVKEELSTVKGVRYSILYMKAVKALQEAMTRIETLETKVAALEAE